MTCPSLGKAGCYPQHQWTRKAVILTAVIVFIVAQFGMQAAHAQTFTVLHYFEGEDGSLPAAELTIDAAGNLYGTTYFGGVNENGTVFMLKHSSSGWILNTLYAFVNGSDGANPWGTVTIDRAGTLYGTTYSGGGPSNDGTVFQLRPAPNAPASTNAPWRETVLLRFTGAATGANPSGNLIFDQSGNLYGTSQMGGASNYGVVYELQPSGGTWTQNILYSPQTNEEGNYPSGGVIFDRSGNLYGVLTEGGQFSGGTVYQLSPSGSGWTAQVLYDFVGGIDGRYPNAGLILDASGNLFGTTTDGGTDFWGITFELAHNGSSWVFNPLYQAAGTFGNLAMDAAGNLYGAIFTSSENFYGSIFKLAHSAGGWTYTSLHEFNGDDGMNPSGGVLLDASGNLYGTASSGGMSNHGVVWEITPQ